MSYTKPTVLVYQELANAGGVANLDPDLPAVVVGPCYNVVDFTVGDETSYINTLSGTIDASGGPIASQVFSYPQEKPGQVVDTDALTGGVKVWYTDVVLELHTAAGFAVPDLPAVSITITDADLFAMLADSPVYGSRLGPGTKVQLTGDTSSTVANTEVVKAEAGAGANEVVLTLADAPKTLLPTDTTAALEVTADLALLDFSTNKGAGDITVNSGDVTIATPEVLSDATMSIVTAKVHIAYRALRTDLKDQIHTFTGLTASEAVLGEATDRNPLALGLMLADANTTTSVSAVAVETNDLAGYVKALEVLEGSDSIYAIAPLTDESDILAAFRTHVVQMSTPEEASWRTVVMNTKIEDIAEVGKAYAAGVLDVDNEFLTVTGGTLLADGIKPGDTAKVTFAAGTTTVALQSVSMDLIVDNVVSNAFFTVLADFPNGVNGDTFSVEFEREYTKQEQAQIVADRSASYNEKRVIHTQPDLCTVNIKGADVVLPGYYLCAGLAGAVAGFPPHQGFTNISLAGYSDIGHSNYYFSREQLNLMAASGTFIFSQAVPGGAPFCRHELTTDMSVLEYREYMKVKNLDYISYYFYDILRPFIGVWNITEDTINTIRQTVLAAAEQLKGRILPRIGAPLVGFNLKEVRQHETNKDHLVVVLEVATADPNNYTNLYLVV